jgi:hypothetical protein
MEKLCPVCGLKFTDTSSGISVGGQQYHDKCIMELRCDNCNKTMGYLARNASVEGRNAKMFCSDCAKTVKMTA